MKANSSKDSLTSSYDNAPVELLSFSNIERVIDLCDIGLIVLNPNKRVVFWNIWMESNTGISQQKSLGKSLKAIFESWNCLRLEQGIKNAIDRGMSSLLSQKFNPHVFPLYTSTENKSINKCMNQMVTVKPLKGNKNFCLIQISDVSSAVARDVLLRKQAIESKRRELETKAILSSTADGVITTDRNGRINYMNVVAEHISGWKAEEASELYLDKVFNVTNSKGELYSDAIHRCLKDGELSETKDNDLILMRENGLQIAIEHSLAPIRNEQHECTGVVVVFRDVTESRELADKVNWQASHDMLTKLHNRNAFDLKLTALVNKAQQEGKTHSLLYLDLDQFKIVNDTCGHVAGDELLKQVATILDSHVRDNDVLARLGGDEFGILLNGCKGSIAVNIANKIRLAIEEFRFGWDGKTFSIGVSIGIVEIDQLCPGVQDVLGNADAACYAAKDNGRNQVHLFQPDAKEIEYHHGEMAWFSRIQKALDDDRFILYSQAIAPLKQGANSHYEILVRMLDDKGAIIPPGAFIPAAERYGLMTAIDRWVIDRLFQLIEKERESIENKNLCFAVNLSGATLTNLDTLNFIVEQIKCRKIPQGMISFEITETSAISNLSAATNFIQTLRGSGCTFSLDDFGSGLSSFAYLKSLPVDFLKIDGAFVKDMHQDPIDRAMVESINQVGHVMGLKTIAEFVENNDIIECLIDIGVDYVQGYGVSKPIPLTDRNGKISNKLGEITCSLPL